MHVTSQFAVVTVGSHMVVTAGRAAGMQAGHAEPAVVL